jgi:hypothetical protein
MILSILITAAASVNLFLFSSMRNYSRETFLLANLQGIFIIHSAHLIFDFHQQEDYSLLLKSSFNILYLPLLWLVVYAMTSTVGVALIRALLGLCLLIFSFFYYHLLIEHSMKFVSYANLLYHFQIVVLAVLSQHALAARERLKALDDPATYSQYRLTRTWCFVLLTPYIVDLTCYALPSDNFLVAYTPVISQEGVTGIITLSLMLLSGFRLIQHKRLLRTANGSHLLKEIEDLAF